MWQQDTLTKLGTEVCIFHSTNNFQEAAYVKEFLFVLQQRCASAFLELSINIQQNKGGQIVSTITTVAQAGWVSALIASVPFPCKDFIPPAISVNGCNPMDISAASLQHWN